MKTFRRILLLALAGALPLGLAAQNDQKPAAKDGGAPPQRERPQGQGQGGRGQRGARTPEERLKSMTEALTLTADQQAKLKPILEDQAKQQRALRDDAALSDEDRRKKSTALREEFNGKIKAVLTPEQQTKWEKMRQGGGGRQGGPRQGGGQGGGGRPGGGNRGQGQPPQPN